MKVLKISLQILKYLFIIIILLFALATALAGSYMQTIGLVLAALLLIFRLKFLQKTIGKPGAVISRSASAIVLLVLSFTVFSGGPKTTIYTSEESKKELTGIYDKIQASWPADTEDIYLQSSYGTVHVLTCGSKENPPLVMFHAASMGAHSWAENIQALCNDYCIYSFDNIGEGNKSSLNDALVFPQSGKELADLYASLMDSLEIEKAPVFGASNGGFIAQMLAYYYPQKVESLLLFGPMGLTQLTKGSIFMMSVVSMYPFQFIRKSVSKWALGSDAYCQSAYGDWFDCITRGTIPSIAQPVPMTTEQKRSMTMPILLFLGTQDKIVGDAETAKKTAEEYPNIQTEVLESGHLVAVEEREIVNRKIKEFLRTD